MRRKKGLLLLSLVLVLVVLAGCSTVENDVKASEEIPEQIEDIVEVLSVTDDFGRTIEFESPVESIVTFAPSNTEILFAIGAGDTVKGVTAFDDYPEEVLEIEKIGDYNGINLERIIELEPEVVIFYGKGADDEVNRLEEAGITVLGFEPESIEEIIDVIERMGTLTGKSTEAQELAESMASKKEELVGKVENFEKKKVFYEIWHEPLMAAGAGSFVDQLIILAGGENIAADSESEYPQFDLEQLIERNPEVYLTANDLPEKTADSIGQRPGYDELDAVKNGQIYLLDGNLMSRPGPRIIEALELLVEAIHPEA
ncbi:MAG: cobalamin-binding protein [Gudongella sp.]|jgi:iron complex transport system substrate-binding protein|nr:cobalamin-binding protein [Gudongella sp.]